MGVIRPILNTSNIKTLTSITEGTIISIKEMKSVVLIHNIRVLHPRGISPPRQAWPNQQRLSSIDCSSVFKPCIYSAVLALKSWNIQSPYFTALPLSLSKHISTFQQSAARTTTFQFPRSKTCPAIPSLVADLTHW